jgi:hypothetical protein
MNLDKHGKPAVADRVGGSSGRIEWADRVGGSPG